MVRERESNSWSVSGLPCRKYSSIGALADMRLASKRRLRIVSVSVIGSMSRLCSTTTRARPKRLREFQHFV